jgi:4-diphosphocytidyl-2-C-methyl-D-erythritol kinase
MAAPPAADVSQSATGSRPNAWTIWPAPAKLNLFLHIVGRRADGYHLLQTVFQLLDWGDDVRLRVRADGDIRRLDPLPGVAAQADLAVRAARALREASGTRLGADIAIEKRIPLGGGLGGGSSDAATTLAALNELWKTGLDEQALAELGAGLGADVPVFVHGRSAWAEGVGDELVPLALPYRWYVVIDPAASVPTRELFQAAELTRNSQPLTIPLFASGVPTRNVFEPVVCGRFPAVAAALDWLAGYGEARLSGSGGCIFAPVASREAGLAVLAECPPGMRGVVARGADESPLRERLAAWRKGTVSGGASPSW